ncbi:MAG: polyprenyl synthetase family protein [Anaerolineaceae bacterium]|nr:polyprenyl synthetase family protein [Anaerolineaceae bacterium]
MDLITDVRESFEEYFKSVVLDHCPAEITGLNEMVSYHFGWDGSAAVPGKRLRPMFLILIYASLGGVPAEVFQAASALEVLHNFTLIHDDIQDQGEIRHGHPALWTQVGVPLAINVGDYLAGLSQYLMGKQPEVFPLQVQHQALIEFQDASLGVIQGQQLDIQYEHAEQIRLEDYMAMITLKTSRLFSAAFSIGAILMEYEDQFTRQLARIGRDLGLGFQIQDDYLGIWGNSDETGKSVSTDLLTRKKAYPAVAAMGSSQTFRQLWIQENQAENSLLEEIKTELEHSQIKQKTLQIARKFYLEAQTNLNQLLPAENEYTQVLLSLVTSMFAPVLADF